MFSWHDPSTDQRKQAMDHRLKLHNSGPGQTRCRSGCCSEGMLDEHRKILILFRSWSTRLSSLHLQKPGRKRWSQGCLAAASSHPRPRVSAMAFSPRSSEKQAVEVLVMFPCKATRKKKDGGLISPLCRTSLKQACKVLLVRSDYGYSKAGWEMPSDCVYWQNW